MLLAKVLKQQKKSVTHNNKCDCLNHLYNMLFSKTKTKQSIILSKNKSFRTPKTMVFFFEEGGGGCFFEGLFFKKGNIHVSNFIRKNIGHNLKIVSDLN